MTYLCYQKQNNRTMAHEITLTTFVYPGCVIVCNGSAKFRNGNLPEIARIYKDRSIDWMRKRVSETVREQVYEIARTPYLPTTASQNDNFFEV